jgi:leucyl/phenylalanyl-tRNA--protein transferase
VIPIETLLAAYGYALFPMGMPDGSIAWFSPDPRGIIPLEQFHVPHGLRRVLQKSPFEIRIDTEFLIVMQRCAAREETWINQEIIDSYVALHRAGNAHSVEAWQDGELVGGLYGVSLGGAFFGESMFHLARDASKVALVALVDRLRARGYSLLDTQWSTPHLAQFGCIEIPRSRYIRLLRNALMSACAFDDRADVG